MVNFKESGQEYLLSVRSLIALLWVCNMIQLSLRYSWGVALPQASFELSLSRFQAGVVASFFYIGYVITGIPSGFLVDRYGTKPVTLASLFLLGLLSFWIGFSRNFFELLLAFLLSGVVAGPIFPSSMKTAAEKLSASSRATGVGALESVSPFAMVAAATLFPFALYALNWRFIYYGLGAFSFSVFVVYSVFAPNTKPNKRAKSALSLTLTNRRLILAVTLRLGGMWGVIALSAWFYTICFRIVGIKEAQILYILLACFAILGQVVGGYFSDKQKRRGLIETFGMLAFGASSLALWLSKNSQELLILAPFLGFFAFFWKSGLDTHILELVEPSQRGSAVGFMNTVSQIGSLLSPAAIGYTLDRFGADTFYPFLTFAIGPLLSSALMLMRFPVDTQPADKIQHRPSCAP